MTRRSRRAFLTVVVIGLICTSFVLGLAIGYRKLPPSPQLLSLVMAIRAPIAGTPTAEAELMASVFNDPIIAGLIYPAITSPRGIKASNDSIFLPVDDFPQSYRKLRVVSAAAFRLGNRKLLRVEFDLAGRRHEAFAYAARADWTPLARKPAATLIIPGSGTNMSTATVDKGGGTDTSTALPALARSDSDLFVFIKPNEDALAFHNGRAKLTLDAIRNYHLNRGGSYGASYIVHSLAVTKYLQSRYGAVVVAGISQGGTAALVNALQSAPHAAIVASGYSALGDQLEIANFQQITIPGYWKEIAPDALTAKLKAMPTRFLFTWGLRDTSLYRLDAESGYTCKRFREVATVTCRAHEGGHEYPVDLVQTYLQGVLSRNASAERSAQVAPR